MQLKTHSNHLQTSFLSNFGGDKQTYASSTGSRSSVGSVIVDSSKYSIVVCCLKLNNSFCYIFIVVMIIGEGVPH